VVLTPEHLEVLAHSLTAVLGVWLGLTVLTRFETPLARVFAFLSLTVVVWSGSILVQRLSTSVSATETAFAIEELTSALIVPATAHLSLVIATEGHPSRRQVQWLALAYALNLLWALPGVISADAQVAIDAPQFVLVPVPGEVFGWARLATRVATLVVGVGWLLGAYRRTKPDNPRRRQLTVTVLAVLIATVGGIIRLLSEVFQTDPWIGLTLVTLAMVISASVVFSPGFFFPPEVAGRAFWTALALGFGLFLLVGALLVVDTISRDLVGIDLPLPTILVLVITIAIYEPAVAWTRRRTGGRSPADVARGRLLAALGQPALTARSADAGVQPALTRVTKALDLAGATVVRQDGTVAATEGHQPDPLTSPTIALVAQDEVMGEMRVGRTRSGAPLRPDDEALLLLSAEYVAAALRAGRRENEQAAALSGLSEERAEVDSSGSRLYEALVRRSAATSGLHLFALGPLRVERDGQSIERWGGEKAGSRQALGLFAFLFDRGERGVAKDEVLDLIWPDTDVDRADLAFHRTLGGLRHTLGPGASGRRTIEFHNDRYRLDPKLLEWSDVHFFLSHLERARVAQEPAERLRLLEVARALYRGEYLDDCPFYGDSSYVEEQRSMLRSRSIDLLIALGEGYEASGDRVSAAAAFREAVATALDDCPLAEAGLRRLAAV
jgi:DNA-binding SARP family transcriptional activator